MPHPKKEIAAAIDYAEENGWKIVEGGAHAWGQMYCPYHDKECRCGTFCRASIWCTPKDPENHAKQIRRIVDNCTAHRKKNDDNQEDKE